MKLGFSLVVTGIFLVAFVLGVLVFSGILPKPESSKKQDEVLGTVNIWGTFPQDGFRQIIADYYPGDTVIYTEKDSDTFGQDLLEALAQGTGPDIVLLPQDMILKWQKSLLHIPYSVLTERQFRDSYLDQGRIYLRSDGILALPFYIDPMVMYWNQDLFAQEGLVSPPKYWDKLYDLTPKLTKRMQNGNITQSAVALGEYRNVDNAKDILAMMMLQLGNPIVQTRGGEVKSTIMGNPSLGIPPVNYAFSFYTNFSDPSNTNLYSWNRALPNAESMFLNQKLAIYFGFASEYFDLQKKNPLLNFDVAEVPQVKDTNFEATIGKIYGVAILKRSDNKQSAFKVALTLAGTEFSNTLSQATYLPPVHRELYGDGMRPTDAVRSVFYDSAIISRGWADPDPEKTSQMFQTAVENISSGASGVTKVVSELNSEFDALLQGLSGNVSDGGAETGPNLGI